MPLRGREQARGGQRQRRGTRREGPLGPRDGSGVSRIGVGNYAGKKKTKKKGVNCDKST